VSDLPNDHSAPPFLLVVDVGYVIEVFADFSGQGRNYSQFPDRRSFRIPLDQLADEDVRAQLKAIWENPQSLDPARRSAEVTRDIADRLARVAKALEGKHDPRDVAEFLMRCLFTMFAEDVELLPEETFQNLLGGLVDDEKSFVPALEHLWKTMDEGGFEPRTSATLKRFNGSLFKDRTALPLAREQIHELHVASQKQWGDVEPAIFGTLLERALDPKERAKLGAHYTPRAYVERLVIPTIIEPLRDDWLDVQARANELHEAGKDDEAIKVVKTFHHQLCTTRVLDPACGTGNFLYVSLELMKRLEGDVLEALDALGEDAPKFAMEGETVGPRQFYGLEINPRAVPIADLVLWIGYLKWQIKTSGAQAITEPVLDAYGTIRQQDAILAFDKQEMLRDETGKPLTRWDGETMTLHPITGEEVPDTDATLPLYTYTNPRKADWPEVEFIVGNPPFIGGKDMRRELGDGYAEAAWKARNVPGGADFVMHFWDEAAARVARKGTKAKPNPLRRFGFITTNSITQTFSRRVVEGALAAKQPISLIYAVPDHPWMKASDKAAVRIAMTVAEKGEHEGVLAEMEREADLNTDTPTVELERRTGKITGKLTLGANLASAKPLMANEALSSRGVSLHGAGFIVDNQKARHLGLGSLDNAEKVVRNYRNGRDIAGRPRNVMVIDLFGTTPKHNAREFPAIHQHILDNVKPERDENSRKTYRENWWLFGEPRSELRSFTAGLPRYITTIETAKHRFFQFLDADILPDNKLLNIGLADADHLTIFCSRLHVNWFQANAGKIGVYALDSVYVKTRCFDPFPFPACLTDDSNIELRDRLSDLGERLDAHRKARLEEHEFLTMTGMYNVLERVRELDNKADVEPLTEAERDVYNAAQIAILKDIHDQIDRATLEAYGWDDLADDLVGKPGATMPSPHKTEAQETAEEELLKRLVDLNVERQAEEARGLVRWLRPDYQIPKLGHKVPGASEQLEAEVAVLPVADQPKWPADGLDQIRVLRDVLARVEEPVMPEALSAVFSGRSTSKRKDRVEQVLKTLVVTGAARTDVVDGRTVYFESG
jgi:hypothetical protein